MKHKYFSLMLTVLMSMTANVANADEHECVDLGLPSGTLWATCNIGANSPEEYGDYIAWGETSGYMDGKTNFDFSTYKYCNGTEKTLTRYCNDSNFGYNGFNDMQNELLPEDDAAYVNWGDAWRIPTKEQFEELINSDYTTTEWVTQNGVNGRRITSRSNGNSIFLPAADVRSASSLYNDGIYGCYLSSTLGTSYVPSYAHTLDFRSSDIGIAYEGRCNGKSVRPIRMSIPPTSITLNHETFTLDAIGKNVQLEATILPENTTNKEISWKSYNESVCIVNNGLVVATGYGSTIVTATTIDGGLMVYCTITVGNNTAVTGIETTSKNYKVFSLQGAEIPQMQRGINIVRMKDGTSRKVLVK